MLTKEALLLYDRLAKAELKGKVVLSGICF